jgi:SAM-dependent methyltransferase
MSMPDSSTNADSYREERIEHWNRVASWQSALGVFRKHYHKQLERQYRFLVPSGARILELGCGKGDLLAALEPAFGVGIDFSQRMIELARQRHPTLHFVKGDAHALPIAGTFDYVILSDLVNDLWDVQRVLEGLKQVSHGRTRIVINTHSRLWQWPLGIARSLGLKRPDLEQNWLTVEDLENLLRLANSEIVKTDRAILLPTGLPILDPLANRVLARLWPFSLFTLTNILVARPLEGVEKSAFSVSVVIPARNEAGNIEALFERTPELGMGTELVFVEGHSKDETYLRIQEEIKKHPKRQALLMKQTGVGKADAVRMGFQSAKGDVLMILDADLSVAPEELNRFYKALVSRRAEFVNGVRLVYPMEGRAMRLANLAGNKFFSQAFSWLLGQPIKDTLCGTKVLWRDDYALIEKHWPEMGEKDPFGDFDLLFGAAKLCLKIVDLPIRYRERTYGETNIDRWRHGWMLLKMVVVAARRLKFV